MAGSFRWLGRSEDGENIVLKRFQSQFSFPDYATSDWMEKNHDLIRTGVVLDVETTGLSSKKDSIIEIGIRTFQFNRSRGHILKIGEGYSGLQDPGQPLSEFIQRLTGITDEDVRGLKIDWGKVNHLLSEAQLIIAHNAAFDRPFVDQFSEVSRNKVWACSLKQVDWTKNGFHTSKLEFLNIYHGFFTDSHRALADAEALLYLLSLPTPHDGETPYFRELLENARRPLIEVKAEHAPFEGKENLKQRGYGWDQAIRCWKKTIFKDSLDDEIAWLEAMAYNGAFKGSTRDIAPLDQFKADT
jgi:DNA polymerase III subunit epsilon